MSVKLWSFIYNAGIGTSTKIMTLSNDIWSTNDNWIN